MTTPAAEPRIITPGQAVLANQGQWTNKEAYIIGTAIAPGLDQDDLRVFAMICKHTGMDPFKRQIYAWKDKGRIAIHIGINGWRGIASRSGEYSGQVGPQWCGEDGAWKDVWLADGPPAAARVGVLRNGATEPVWGIVTYREFGQSKAEAKTQKGTWASPMWHEKPAHMLAIRAEYQALQKACPEAYAAAMTVITDSRAILDVGDESEMPALPANLDTETGELRDVTPADEVDSPESNAGEGTPGSSGLVATETEAAPSPATQPGLLDGDGGQKPSAMRTLTDDDWTAMGAEMADKDITAKDVGEVLGKPFNANSVKEWLREHDAPWQQLIDQSRVRKQQAARRS